jgi:hypothetical protein
VGIARWVASILERPSNSLGNLGDGGSTRLLKSDMRHLKFQVSVLHKIPLVSRGSGSTVSSRLRGKPRGPARVRSIRSKRPLAWILWKGWPKPKWTGEEPCLSSLPTGCQPKIGSAPSAAPALRQVLPRAGIWLLGQQQTGLYNTRARSPLRHTGGRGPTGHQWRRASEDHARFRAGFTASHASASAPDSPPEAARRCRSP